MSRLVELISGRRLAVLTGAGCSTASGIPDYRGEETRKKARNPIQFRQFVDSEAFRRRYWSRSMIGWPNIKAATPNPAHHALAELAMAGVVRGLITQNVDGLHEAAGTPDVLALHGRLSQVICLGCGDISERSVMQQRLLQANPKTEPHAPVEMAPDGDAELDADLSQFTVPACTCGGVLKPHVVFFGENVPRSRVDKAKAWVEQADVLMVIGSSLTVFSGFRFVKQAQKLGRPVVIINKGPTRGDPLATLKVDADCGEVLTTLADAVRL